MPTTAATHQPSCSFKAQLWLDLDGSVNISQIIKHSLRNPRIQFLDIVMRESFLVQFESDEKFYRLMQRIGTLPQLERLDITCPTSELLWHSSSHDATSNRQAVSVAESVVGLPIRALQLALAPSLTHLLLVNLKLTGSSREFHQCAMQLQQLTNLQFVALAEIRLVEPTNNTTTNTTTQQQHQQQQQHEEAASNIHKKYSRLDCFLRALSKLPNLRHILMTGGQPNLGSLQSNTLQHLCSLPRSLKDLCLSQFRIPDYEIVAMMTRNLLVDAGQLRALDLECDLDVAGAKALAYMLQSNTAILEDLTLRLPLHCESDTDTASSSSTTTTTTVNNAQQNYGRCSSENPTTQQLQQRHYLRNIILARGVARSRLQNFEFHNASELSQVGAEEPFRQMLRENYTLQSCRLTYGGTTYVLKDVIAFYVRLNRLGRGQLLVSQRHNMDWINMLERVNGDISALYYFLRTMPMLCCNSSSTTRSRRSRQQAKTFAKLKPTRTPSIKGRKRKRTKMY